MSKSETDEVSPELKANWFSLASFHWVTRIFILGWRRELTQDDIFPVDPRLKQERLTALLEHYWIKECARNKKPSLLRTLFRRHSFFVTWLFFAAVGEGLLRCITPLIVARTSAYLQPDPDHPMDLKEACIWAGLLGICHLTYLAFRSIMFYKITRFGAMLRLGLSGLIYRKACRLTQQEMSDKSTGYIMNLMSNDAQRCDESSIVPAYVLTNIWAVISFSFGIMYMELGLYATLAGYFSMFLFIPIQIVIGRFIQRIRTVAAPLTDSRLKIIHEIVSSMKIIKMYGWEYMFKELTEKIRKEESKYLGIFVLCRLMNIALLYVSPVFCLIVVIAVKRAVKEVITPSEVLFFISLLGVLRVYLNVFLGSSFTLIPQVIHSLKRIEEFLSSDEIPHLKIKPAIETLPAELLIKSKFIKARLSMETITNGIQLSSERANSASSQVEMLKLDGIHARWSESEFSIRDVSLQAEEGELIAVVGPVACGKSTLLMSILKELDTYSGTIHVGGEIDYASQTPWIFNGNIEENIVFNRPYDKNKLNKVIEACYLTRDLELLPYGINTLVGERGVQLSGGQRARINLARAIYGGNPVILMDDPLSAVDSRCAKHIFDKLIKGYLKKTTRILVTHSTHFLPGVDRIVVMEADNNSNSGKITHIGSYQELTAQGLNLSNFVTKRDKKRMRTLSSVSSIGESTDDDADSQDFEEEVIPGKPSEVKEEKQSGSLDKMLYLKFMSLSFGYMAVPLFLIVMLLPSVGDLYQQKHVLAWLEETNNVNYSNTSPAEAARRDTTSYHIFLGIACGTIVLYILRAVFSVFVLNASARKLHGRALYAVLRSPMRFFDVNPVGLIINRFAKDTFNMDEKFPDVFTDFVGLGVFYLATVALLLAANWYFVFLLLPLIVVMFFVIRFYLKTSIEIRRLEAISRSPVLSHVSSTLTGITTIRASHQVEIYEKRHYELRDKHTQGVVLFMASSRWLNFRLDSFAIVIIITATFACLLLKNKIGAQLAALAIVYINNIVGGFQWCVRQSTECENLMTAIERIFAFAELPSEAVLTKDKHKYSPGDIQENTLVTEPKGAVVVFEDVRMKYSPELDYVLHGLTFKTLPSEKIGIVGRTGAGKSTILQALFRMVEPEGDVYIDGILTRDLGLHTLRQSISVIPQESLLFSETLRKNLDPFYEYSDEEIWNSLDKVELKAYFSSQPHKLETQLQEGGGNLSAGQRQLLCLARALLRHNNLLVIDEATANVDEKTDALIQSTLREKFSNCTVLTIAHRINTIIDSDRIMVMDAGNLIEFDHPHILLSDPTSHFSGLVQETGVPDMLKQQAEEHYNKHYTKKESDI